MCQIILKSLNEQQSYGPDKLIYGHFLPSTSKCDLDLWEISVILSHDTLSIDGEQMCQMILKSHIERQSNGPDKLIYGHFWPFTSKCDLDLGDIDIILSSDTPSNDGEQMCQMILKSHIERHRYSPDKLIYGHFWRLNSKCDLDLEDINIMLSHDTPSNDGEQMCQMILKSHIERHRYCPDKLIYGHFWPLTSKCDLDLGDIDIILSSETPSNDGEQMCQMILKSHIKWHRYGPDKLIYGHFLPLTSKCDLDLGDIDVLLSRDTPSNDGEQMCQMILKSLNEQQSYGPDKLIYGHFWPLTSKCDLDLGDIDVILSRDTPSNHGEQMCQMILKSHNERHSYGPDKLISGQTDRPTDKVTPI